MRRIASDRSASIAPFGEPLADLSLLGETFAALREEEIASSGIDPARLTIADHAFATGAILRDLALRAPRSKPSALAVSDASTLAAIVPVSSVRRSGGLLVFDVFLDAPSTMSLEELREIAQPVLVGGPKKTHRRELARVGPPPHHLELPDDDRIAAHVEHWVHLLWLAPLLVVAQVRGKNRIGRGARVHPTAYVEGSIIAPGAHIGAGCSIRHSYVGKDARLADFTKLTRSVLGGGVHTLADATFSHVVSLGEGTLTNLLLRDVLIGRRVFLTSGVIFWAETLGETIAVEDRGALADTRRRLLGGCVGHGSVLGARTIIAPGRALPNRTMIVMRREEGVLRVETAKKDAPLCWHEAALVPYESLRPGETPDEIGDVRLSRALSEVG
jgi:carbonic anhydrase/acetyltransferase-like protein (isoleucine patch superfamily)